MSMSYEITSYGEAAILFPLAVIAFLVGFLSPSVVRFIAGRMHDLFKKKKENPYGGVVFHANNSKFEPDFLNRTNSGQNSDHLTADAQHPAAENVERHLPVAEESSDNDCPADAGCSCHDGKTSEKGCTAVVVNELTKTEEQKDIEWKELENKGFQIKTADGSSGSYYSARLCEDCIYCKKPTYSRFKFNCSKCENLQERIPICYDCHKLIAIENVTKV